MITSHAFGRGRRKELDMTVKIFKKSPEEIEKESADLVRRRYNALASAALGLEEQNKKLVREIEVCYAKLENAQKNVDINKKIVMDSIILQNQTRVEFSKEIDELTAKLKKAQKALEA